MPLANFVEYRARLVELEPRIQVLERALAPLRLEESTIKERLNAYKYPRLDFTQRNRGPNLSTFPPKISYSGERYLSPDWNAYLPTPATYGSGLGGLDVARCPSGYSTGATIMAAWQTLLWQSFQLALAATLPTIEGEFPLLRYLDIELGCEAPREIQFLDAPMLRSVVLDGLAVEWVTRLPWTQLTTLSLHDIAFEDCVPVLPKATNLLDCRLDMSEDLISSKASPIVLPCLKSLKAEADDYIEGFLASFTLPALSSLTVCHELLGLDAVPSLKSFVARSGCNLQHLHMTCITATQFVEESYRVALPSIRKIDFSVDQDREPLNLLSNWHI
ncbi:hypothetical protein R3P38DRAFT_3200845 [Favolaschia claudopus]|uniref:Uncharacterized protein n=1 Tax=Favolaschia claudopus TaxID=2862362 RepID=A0AAW0AYV6_9AGAR